MLNKLILINQSVLRQKPIYTIRKTEESSNITLGLLQILISFEPLYCNRLCTVKINVLPIFFMKQIMVF